MKKIAIYLVFLLTCTITIHSQTLPKPVREVELHIDTAIYYLSQHNLEYQNREHLYFEYDDEEQICDVFLYPDKNHTFSNFRLKESGDYNFIDSMIFVNNEYYRFKVQFKNLNQSKFIRFTVLAETDSTEIVQEINLFPLTETYVKFYPLNDELYIGETKIFELITNNPENIRLVNDWTTNNNIDYRLTEKFNQLQLHLLPNKTGVHKLNLKLQTIKPYLNENKELVYKLPEIEKSFFVKKSRLRFLHVNKNEVTMDETASREGVAVQIENNPMLRINRTYRIEDQEDPGGPLIAELYTRRTLANDKVLCWLRVYNFHRKTEGYLYIKENDVARFITNFNITPKTSINSLKILRDGKNWTTNTKVYPGETILVRLEGKGFHKAKFNFENIHDVKKDSFIVSESIAEYEVKIPLSISKKDIAVLNHGEPTGHQLNVNEYQNAREFDYIMVNYGAPRARFSGIRGNRIHYKTIKDIEFTFVENRIDDKDKLFGKQYLNMEVEIRDKKNKLIELKSIDNIVICPDDQSPRYKYYDKSDCRTSPISLNDHLSTNTNELPEWASIDVKIDNDKDKHGKNAHSDAIRIVQGRKFKFDIDVSFPAGLITVYKQEKTEEIISQAGDTTTRKYQKVDFGNLGGISMAMIAQFSFYKTDEGQIARYRPYKLGAGFIAMNAFNFTENANKDLAVVLLGSVYPTTKDTRLTFPLYVGGGYLFQEGRMFFLVGPGIRVSL